MFQKLDYVMVMVSDMQSSIHFYRDLLGIPLKFESPGWTEFQTGDTTLALHGWGGPQRAKVPAEMPAHPTAGTCSFGFNVEDIKATCARLEERGVRFLKPPTLRENEGIWLAIALDPDDLPISIAQHVKKAAAR